MNMKLVKEILHPGEYAILCELHGISSKYKEIDNFIQRQLKQFNTETSKKKIKTICKH